MCIFGDVLSPLFEKLWGRAFVEADGPSVRSKDEFSQILGRPWSISPRLSSIVPAILVLILLSASLVPA